LRIRREGEKKSISLWHPQDQGADLSNRKQEPHKTCNAVPWKIEIYEPQRRSFGTGPKFYFQNETIDC
jgi:hypothetical protein